MPFVPAPNTAMVELIYNYQGQIAENVLYFRGAVPWTTVSLNALAADVLTWWSTRVKGLQPAQVSLTSIRLTSLESEVAPRVDYVTGLPQVGGDASLAPMPNNVTVVTTFLTALRGRSFRGRSYWIGLSEQQVLGNFITNSVRTDIQVAWNSLATDVNENGAAHVVVSRITGGVQRPVAVVTDITGYRTDDGIDSQRRRLPGRGN